MNEIDEKLEN